MSKGVLYSLLSRALFVVGGYAIHIYVARLLGPKQYGIFGICLAIITICYVFLGSGVRQSISKSVAQNSEASRYYLRKGIVIQLMLSSILALLTVAVARNSLRIFRDASLEIPLYISAVIIFIQSLFFANMGVLNGLRRFGAENTLMGTYSVIKASAAILLVSLGFGVLGGLSGFLIASICTFVLGVILTRDLPNITRETLSLRAILRDTFPIIVIFGSITFAMNMDLLAVKYFIVDAQVAGYYTSASAISKLMYWFFVAFGVVILPFVSTSYHLNDLAATRTYVNKTTRYTLVLILPVMLIIAMYARGVVVLIYGREYLQASAILQILVWGLLGVGLSYLYANVMIGITEERVMVTYALTGIVLALVLNAVLIPCLGAIGGALATLLSSSIVALFSYAFIVRKLKIEVNAVSIAKVVFALLIVFIVACASYRVALHFIYKGMVLYGMYLLLLYAIKEIKGKDINLIRGLVCSVSGVKLDLG